MPPLFCLALEEGIEVELVQQLIRMFRLKPPTDAPDLWPRPVRIQTLGRFEVQIDDRAARVLAQGPEEDARAAEGAHRAWRGGGARAVAVRFAVG